MKILLIGDNCEDVWIEGDVSRLSPEAPVPVFVPVSRRSNLGMAGNVLANLKSLGPDMDVIPLLPQPASTKTRYVDRKTGHHFIRMDETKEGQSLERAALDYAFSIHDFAAVVVSDYAKGFLTDVMLEHISERCRLSSIPLFIDTKRVLWGWAARAIVKINEAEYLANVAEGADPWPATMIVTRGGEGMDLYENGLLQWHMPAVPIEVKDGAGCGDSVLAALVVRWLENEHDLKDAMEWAGKVGAVAVSKRGVVAVSREDVA